MPRQRGSPALKHRSSLIRKQFELSGPAFIGLLVRDVAAAADFYEHKLGMRPTTSHACNFRQSAGASSNTAVLQAMAAIAPAGVTITLYDQLAELPYFNPDLDRESDTPPASVRELRERIGRADGILICSSEYAHGVPGVLKNALDWLVSSLEFPESACRLPQGQRAAPSRGSLGVCCWASTTPSSRQRIARVR